MEHVCSDSDNQKSPEQAPLILTPETEKNIELWQQTGDFPYPNLQAFPPPEVQSYSRTELRLIHHLSSVSNALLVNRTSKFTLWTDAMPKCLSIASSYPYVMHALLSWSANHLAWVSQSVEIRNLHIQHGGVAIRGLHEAIGRFSRSNADAILAASLLLSWQANEWRSYSSLRSGIQTVIGVMDDWRHESLFADYIAHQDLKLLQQHTVPRRTPAENALERCSTLQSIAGSLQRLGRYLNGQDLEVSWIEQLIDYIQRLQTSRPAQNSEETFNHVYMLRKWVHYVPISLLQSQGGKGPALLTIAHLYAVNLSLEPFFPDMGPFYASTTLPPLEEIIQVTDAMRSERGMGQSAHEIAALMQFPRQAAASYRERIYDAQQQQQAQLQQVPSLSTPDLGDNYFSAKYTTMSYNGAYGNPSPALTPAALHVAPNAISSASSYLEVPTPPTVFDARGFEFVTSEWGALPSPGFPPRGPGVQEQQSNGYVGVTPFGGFGGEAGGGGGGFETHPAIWT
ncbi:hypothetical protein LTR66_004972 [Elasticomyces elasticus]|nr:hypothetical protein LTR66_004972 [Elasticomyces elasticus]